MLQFVQRPRKHSTEDNGQNRSQSHCLHDGCVETGHNSGLYSEQADWRLRRRTGSTRWIIRHKATLYKVEPFAFVSPSGFFAVFEVIYSQPFAIVLVYLVRLLQ